MRRLLYAVAVGLVGAGIVHIVVLLLLPDFSERDAWSRLESRGELYRMIRIDGTPAAAEVIHRSADPLFYVAACRFDLEEGYAHITAPGRVPYWSVSVYDRSGQNIYSFNDRTATSGQLDFVVLTPPQMIDVRKELPEALVSSVFVEADIDQGIALVRVFVPDASWAPQMTRYIDGLICRRE
ncbi:MAG: DUF1254 domain-containing protein [Hyphomicrobiales bacterium]|jgi:uncharacterized membrane protein|nr:DUF1254 domain-containing protein [Hyphomicrobiales bacterium]MCO5083426.1 DUF1254 domain-containing protein [Rhizobiaceae bacterium]